MNIEPSQLRKRIAKPVARYWLTRRNQFAKQAASGQQDQGAHSVVAVGTQMDGFIRLMTESLK